MKITVTQEHIDHGRAMDCTACPIALAVKPLFPDCDVTVGAKLIQAVQPDGSLKAWKLPQEAMNFILRFDMEDHVEPFEFEIRKSR